MSIALTFCSSSGCGVSFATRAAVVDIRSDGEGAIYFTAEAEFFSLEEPVPPAGNEIFVRRDYYKLEPTGGVIHN